MDPAPGAHVSWPHLAVWWLTRRVLCMNLPVRHAGMTLSSCCPGALPGSPLLSGENPYPQSPSSWLLYPCGFLRGPQASSPTKLPLLHPAELSQHQCLEPFLILPRPEVLRPTPATHGIWLVPPLGGPMPGTALWPRMCPRPGQSPTRVCPTVRPILGVQGGPLCHLFARPSCACARSQCTGESR